MFTAQIAFQANAERAQEIVDATPIELFTQPVLPAQPLHSVEQPVKSDVLGLVELILKRRDHLEKLIREPGLQSQLVPRFLAISLIGFVLYGVAISLVFNSANEWPRFTPIKDLVTGSESTIVFFDTVGVREGRLSRWLDGSAPILIAAYAIGLVAATCVCLPSLYFYGLLAGVRMSMLDVVVHALKAKATTAVALVGILPIYAAIGLGIVIFELPEHVREVTFWLGLSLPFLAGLFGTYSLYRGFAGLTDTLPPHRRCRRECFLRRLVLSWSACYTAVMPVMIHTCWVMFSGGS